MPRAKQTKTMRMIDLIRSQQKGKKAAPSVDAPAPGEGGQELERESEEPTPGLREDAWKAPLATIPPLPEEPPIFTPGSSSADELYAAADDILRTIFNAASRRKPFAIEPAAEIAQQFGQATAKEDLRWAIKESFVRFETLVQQTLVNNFEKSDLVHQGLNVAIYALKIGNALDYPLVKLKDLALAGMLHDIGLTWLPEAILSKPGPLSQRERALIEEHPLHSYEMLRGLGPKWEWLAEVTLQHHEREDGSGYPKRLMGDQIHEYAKIVGICDIYEAIAHARPDRKGSTPVDAIKEIMQTEREGFPQTILKAFINGMSSYPVGSWLRLSSKEIGRVIATNKANPLRPVLEVCYDASGKKLSQPKVIDLTREVLLHITGPATEEARTG